MAKFCCTKCDKVTLTESIQNPESYNTIIIGSYLPIDTSEEYAPETITLCDSCTDKLWDWLDEQ
jgi:hypothetical protein